MDNNDSSSIKKRQRIIEFCTTPPVTPETTIRNIKCPNAPKKIKISQVYYQGQPNCLF